MPGDGDPARDSYGKGVSPFRPAVRKPVLHRVVPVSEQLPGYRGGVLRRDLLAGVTVAALALPAAMAYAELAGLSPVAGLYALLLPPDRGRWSTRAGCGWVVWPRPRWPRWWRSSGC